MEEGCEHSSRHNGIIADGSRGPTHWTGLGCSGPGGLRRSTADVAAGCSIRGHHHLVVARAMTCMFGCVGCPLNNLVGVVVSTWTLV